MDKIELTLFLQDNYSTDMGDLRKICFPNDYANTSDKDEFDKKSIYVVIKDKSSLIAYGRLTQGPNSVFYTWTKGKAQIPNTEDSIDLSRCMVRPDYRRKNILQILCVSGLLISKTRGFKFVNGAVVNGSDWLNMLKNIGFKKSGTLVLGKSDLIQPLSCNIEDCKVDFENLLKTICENLSKNEIDIHVEL